MQFRKYFIGLITLFLLSHFYNNTFSKSMILGTYDNVNFENSFGEPGVPDIIELNEDQTFNSNYFGSGIFEIDHGIGETKILLTKSQGSPFLKTYITRLWYGKPKIILFEDVNHYYIKR